MPSLRTTDRVGVGRFRDGNTYFHRPAAVATLAGGTSMTRFAVVHRLRDKLDTSAPGNQQRIMQRGTTTLRGWSVFVEAGAPEFHFTVADGGANVLVSELPVGDELVHVIGGSYDGSTLRSHHHRGDSNTQAAVSAGYTAPTAADTLVFGMFYFTRPLVDFSIGALMATDTAALSAVDLTSAVDLIKDNLFQGRDLDTGLSAIVALQHYWDARDWVPGQATWTDRIGAEVVNTIGNPELYGHQGQF